MILCLVSLGLFSSLISKSTADYGFIVATSPGLEELKLCVAYNPKFKTFVDDIKSAKPNQLKNEYPSEACDSFSKDFSESVVIVKRGTCEFGTKALNVQQKSGNGVLIVSETSLTTPSANDSVYNEVDITVSLITNDSYNTLAAYRERSSAKDLRVKQYAPPLPPHWDPDSIVMLILAVSACAIGAWMQRVSYLASLARHKKNDGTSSPESPNNDEDGEDLDITVGQAIIFFAMCSVSILLMYFFYDYLVYVIIGIFCYASSMAVFDLIYPLFEKSACFTRNRLPSKYVPFCDAHPPILGIFLFLACAALAVVWAVYRKSSFAWILQDILGFAFCIFMIKQLKLKSFKLTTILLVLFFLYDIFYVFITPLFTKDKQSIMVQVATGGPNSKEELPMLFKLPKFISSEYDICSKLSYSMLGYGDVILPGLHVGFCAIWDTKISNAAVEKHVYYIAAIFGYVIGLILTFLALFLMNTGQPALLYLTPCCLLSTLIVSLKRNELKLIWKGIEAKKKPTPQSANEEAPNIMEDEQTELLNNA